MLKKQMVLTILTLLLGGGLVMGQPQSSMSDIFSFNNKNVKPWQAVNDVVMGGLSQSKMEIEKGIAIFSGKVSLENNGGFASVRSLAAKHDLSSAKGICIRVKGDGSAYKFCLKTSVSWNSVLYQQRFETVKDKWITCSLPLDKFISTFRGRILNNRPLEPKNITSFGFLISDKQKGNFQLEIDWIKQYHSDHKP